MRSTWEIWKQLLDERYGPAPDEPEEGADLPPSWGRLGSLAKQMLHPAEYEHLLVLHHDLLAQERARNPHKDEPMKASEPQPPSPPPPPPRQSAGESIDLSEV